MNNLSWKTIYIALIVSVVGAALWKYIFEPYSDWTLGIIVSVTTFGVESLQNGIYLEIAKGLHEDTSLKIMLVAYSMFFAASIITLALHFIIKNNKNIKEFKNSRTHLFFDSVSRNNIFITIFITFYLVFFTFDLTRSVYVNQAITYYNQLQNISLPYITDEEFRLIDSSFAQIQNSDDYQKVTQILEQIIVINNLKSPTPPSVLSVIKY